MKKIAIAVHGGAGDMNDFIYENKSNYEQGLKHALLEGYNVLKQNGNAIDAVQKAVMVLEDNPFFNAGRGAAWDANGNVSMDAAIMDGKSLKAGAVAMVQSIKNPVALAKRIMDKSKHVLLAGNDALMFAKQNDLMIEEPDYFKTAYQENQFLKNKKESIEEKNNKPNKGTVGAVALDEKGNVAAATSTGGTSGKVPGRVGDSCIIGAGCYANKNYAISGTGDGEYLITGVIAHTIAMLCELNKLSLQEACDEVIFKRNQNVPADIGVIGVNSKGDFGIAYNSKRMHLGWIDIEGKVYIEAV